MPVAPVINFRAPLMAPLAPPPYSFIGKRRQVLGRQVAVFSGMPLAGQIGLDGAQTIFPVHFLTGAIGTSLPVAPVADCSRPFVALRTLPPNFLVGKRGYISRCQAFILLDMPLAGQDGIADLKTILDVGFGHYRSRQISRLFFQDLIAVSASYSNPEQSSLCSAPEVERGSVANHFLAAVSPAAKSTLPFES